LTPAKNEAPRRRQQPKAIFVDRQRSRKFAHRDAGTQHDGDGPASLGVIQGWYEAALVIVDIEQRELLMPVHDITGVGDVGNSIE
jgi:hypothetical protein